MSDVVEMDLDKLAEAAMRGDMDALQKLADGSADETKEEAGSEQEVESAPSGADEQAKEPDHEDHAAGVSTKDGKGVIPYTVLKETRARASVLQQEKEQLEQEREYLKQQLEQLVQIPQPGAAVPQVESNPDETLSEIADMREQARALEDDFPENAALIKRQADLLEKMYRRQLVVESNIMQEREAAQQDQAKAVSTSVQEAIDQIPELSAWQSAQGREWELALEQDRVLRKQPEWADKTFDERFAKVTEIVRVLMPSAAVAPAPTLKSDPSSERPVAPTTPPVNSLSDIPGGVAPVRNHAEQVEGMSAAALGNKMAGMTQDQLMDYLSSFGV
jgi:hypothetical protein